MIEEEADKIKKKIKKEIERHMELDDSDIPVHERYTKEEDIKTIKKKKNKDL